jgi:hypothetical protein
MRKRYVFEFATINNKRKAFVTWLEVDYAETVNTFFVDAAIENPA